MEKLKLLYSKYTNWIIIILVVLFGLKSCQSCSRKNQILYYQKQNTALCDSVNKDANLYSKRIDSLVYELEKQKDKNIQLQREINLLNETNKYYKQSNRKLIDNLNKEN